MHYVYAEVRLIAYWLSGEHMRSQPLRDSTIVRVEILDQLLVTASGGLTSTPSFYPPFNPWIRDNARRPQNRWAYCLPRTQLL